TRPASARGHRRASFPSARRSISPRRTTAIVSVEGKRGRRSPYLGSADAAENLGNTFARCARSVSGQIRYGKKAVCNYFPVRPRRTGLTERTHDIERNVIAG